MHSRWRQWCGMLAVALVLVPLWAVAQPQWREPRADWPRGAIEIINDWRDDVNLSMWTDQRQPLGEWSLQPGDQVRLEERGRPLRVNPDYKIKVGEDWGWVNVGQVGQFNNGT